MSNQSQDVETLNKFVSRFVRENAEKSPWEPSKEFTLALAEAVQKRTAEIAVQELKDSGEGQAVSVLTRRFNLDTEGV